MIFGKIYVQEGEFIMKKKFLLFIAVACMFSMMACGDKQESETKKNDAVQSIVEKEESEGTGTNTSKEEEPDVADTNNNTVEKPTEALVDYSVDKEKVEAFYANIGNYKKGLIKDDRNASWIAFGSDNDYYSGGRYEGNWMIFVIEEETKLYETASGFNQIYPRTEGSFAFEYMLRIGNGKYKICAVYCNEEKNVYFYAEDEVVIDDATLTEYKIFNSFVYNITDLVGADFTAMTYELDNE